MFLFFYVLILKVQSETIRPTHSNLKGLFGRISHCATHINKGAV